MHISIGRARGARSARGARQQRRTLRRAMMAGVALLVALGALPFQAAVAIQPLDDAFQRTWERTDQPVQQGADARSWIWGPEAFSALMEEPYTEGPGGKRLIQYFDKSRMEITNPSGDPNSIWYVTNGLLARELVTGELQYGDNDFAAWGPAQVNVAGDPSDPNGPTYATFNLHQYVAPYSSGAPLNTIIQRNGDVRPDAAYTAYGVTAGEYVPQTNHRVASVFWDFMNSTGVVHEGGQNVTANLFESPYYATGYPITEAYWATVLVGGTPKDVLMQVFERRVLTYTPDNPAEWRVEMGNVGQHYYRWRYDTEVPVEPQGAGFGMHFHAPAWLAQWPDWSLQGESSVFLSNDSLYTMTLRLSGPNGVYEFHLPPTPDSADYPPGPTSMCGRSNLSFMEFTVVPGSYVAQVSFQAPVDSPEWDYWTLVPNAHYGVCYIYATP